MAISVVQSVSGGQGTASLNFSSNVTTGNSVVIIAQGYSSTATSSNPLYNGSTPAGSAKLAELDPTTYFTYAAVWLMPNLTGGSKTVGITIANSSNGFTAVEIAGLGPSPQLDNNGGYSLGYGADSSTGMPSGFTPALSSSSEILIGSGAAYAVTSYTTPGGWVSLPAASYSCVQYQVVSSAAGNTYQYDPSGGSAGWGSLIVAITPASGSGGGSSGTATIAWLAG